MAREEVSRSVENRSSNKPFIPGQNLHYRNYVFKYIYILICIYKLEKKDRSKKKNTRMMKNLNKEWSLEEK